MNSKYVILQICDTPNYRAYADTRTGDIIMQADPTDGFIGGYAYNGYYEVIVRGIKSFADCSHRVDARHISHKQGVVAVLRGYTEAEVDTLDEAELDGILRDYRSAHVLDAIIESRKDTVAA